MSAYAELSAAVREPMREWWKGSGSWWLLGMSACSVTFLLLGLVIQFGNLPVALGESLLVLQMILLWFLKFLAFPLTCLVVARAHLNAIRSTSIEDFETPAIFLSCVRHGLVPLAVFIFLSFLNYVAFDLFVKTTAWADFGGYFQLALHELLTALRFWIAALPPLLVALALYLATKRYLYSLVLLGADLIQYAIYRLLGVTSEHNPPDYWGLKVVFEITLGCWMMWMIFFNIKEREEKDWKAAYWLLIGSICALPFIAFWGKGGANWPMLGPWYLLHGWSYLAFPHNTIGDWLANELRSPPLSGSLLRYLAPVVPQLWQIGSVAALVWWLQWILSSPWRRQSSSFESAADLT